MTVWEKNRAYLLALGVVVTGWTAILGVVLYDLASWSVTLLP